MTAPITSVIRTIFIALNLFSTTYDGREISSNPTSLVQYDSPIIYLIIQIIILFLIPHPRHSRRRQRRLQRLAYIPRWTPIFHAGQPAGY